jgi:RNA polymerase-associated protein LEO1
VPTTDHHSATRSANFSANTVANTTIRYRKNLGTEKLESNTIMSRWSDGTVTLTIGDKTYELLAKPLAPELRDRDGKGYQDVLDSHQYVATPYVESQVLHIVGHMTNQFSVKPNKEIDDDALEKLQSSLSAATKGGHKRDNKDGIAIISSTQDPESQKKEAEMLEKEKLKAQRRRENAAARIEQQAGRVRSGMGGGLSIDDLERGASRFPGSRKKRAAPVGPRRARRKADYDSDDEDAPRGRNREDEYDLEDDFLAPSDDDLEGEGDGDESEEEIDEGSEDESPKMKKQKTSMSKADADAEGDSDVDAEGEIDDAVVPHEPLATGEATAGRSRRRVIIDDEED